MKQKVTPKIMSGFMELLPREQMVFEQLKNTVQEIYESYGFTPLDTPVLELSEVLLAKESGETSKQVYRFMKGDTDISMRFDLTVPLSRYVAKNQNSLTFPFRRYQIAKVYRGERPQKGRFREFYQADIDIIGSEKLSILYDAEIPSIMYKVFTKLGLKRFHIRMNNRKLLRGFYEYLGLEAQSTDILRLVDKLDKIGADNVREGLIELGVSEKQAQEILSFVHIDGTSDDILSALAGLGIQNDAFNQGMSELRIVTDALKALGVPETHTKIDLKITRGLDYYTGTVYETTVDDYPNWGTVCAGGRYDNLAENYTDKKLPGIGMSIGLSRLFDLLDGAGLLTKGPQTPAQVLVLPMGQETSYALKVASALRHIGIRTEVYFSDTKFKNKMAYADKIGVAYVAILGEDEEKNETITLKNMVSGDQETLPFMDVAPALNNVFAERVMPKVINQE